MNRQINWTRTKIETNVVREGQSIEEMIRKALTAKEPIKGNAKLTYNDRKDGVLAQHDIRTDRFEIAMMATDKIHASQAAKRHELDFPADKPAIIDGKPVATAGGEA